MKFFSTLAVVVVMTTATALHAEESAEISQLRAALAQSMPDLEVTDIAESPIPGVLELTTGAQIVYITPDAKYVLEGNLIDIQQRVNITERRQGTIQYAAISSMDESKMVVYRPAEADDKKRTITIFTDTSCPYCSRLHQEVSGLLSEGVSVRYLLYPRAGLGSDAHQELESVWCADDPLVAMTEAKARRPIARKTCDNPIEEHIALARQVGLQGTPLIFLDNGTKIPGYRPAAELLRLINNSPKI